MEEVPFDAYADKYDYWFLANRNVLDSEVKLLAQALGTEQGRCLSVGCGSGLFETCLARDYQIRIQEGVEPSAGMREIAIKRGLDVRAASAETMELPAATYDTIVFNGISSYLADAAAAFGKAHEALKAGGRLLVLDVPKESAFGVLYNFGSETGAWSHPAFAGVVPAEIYPLEFVRAARWTTTPEKMRLLEGAGFHSLATMQTLVRHPVYSNDEVEEPVSGFDRGSYVCITARK
jgi:SAM-dependent methyltransferase